MRGSPSHPKNKPQKISSDDPAARDEGPRLLPLEESRKPPHSASFDQRYLDLADVAMHSKARKPSQR
jgi:hypothetical protein